MSIIFWEKQDNQSFGGKADRLFDLQKIIAAVPSFFVIPHSSLSVQNINSKEFEKELSNALQQINFPVAVRSSANIEDGSNHSFAGMFESSLNLNNYEQVLDGIKKCISAISNQRVQEYLAFNDLNTDDIRLNLIIQEQIKSEVSGVLFSINHQTGEGREMVIEAVMGQGEALVQGDVNPDIYIFNWYEDNLELVKQSTQKKYLDFADEYKGLEWKEMEKQSPFLTITDIKNLCAISLEIQMYYGIPLDIEWCFANNKIYILQARPLTSIHYKTIHDWTNADLKDGGIAAAPATMMMYSLYEMVYENSMPLYFRNIGILGNEVYEKWFTEWMGFSYWNVQSVKDGAKKIPGFIERNFDNSLGIAVNYEGYGFKKGFTIPSIVKGLQILWKTNQSINSRPKIAKKTIEAALQFYQFADDFLKNQIDEDNLPTILESVRDQYLFIESNYFYTIYDNSNAATFCQESIQKLSKKGINQTLKYLELIIGLKDLSHLRPSKALWNLSRKIIADKEALAFYKNMTANKLVQTKTQNIDFPYHNDWKDFISNYKYKSKKELDLLAPRWDDDYSQPLEQLQDFLNKNDNQNPELVTQNQYQKFLTSFEKIKSKKVRNKVQIHRNLLWWREEVRDHSTKTYFYIRSILIKIGKHYKEKSILKNEMDIFFIKLDELIAFTKNNDTRKFIAIIENNKKYFASFQNFNKPNEIFRQPILPKDKKAEKTKELTGIAGAPGLIKGKARVITDIKYAERIENGDILVTKSTDPGWTTYFSKILGLVTETGGMLSHGAVVSREYGLAAVMGVDNACILIKDGDIITVDGYNGHISIVKND